MARHSINTAASANGALSADITLDLGATAIAAGDNTSVIVLNTTSSVLRANISAGSAVTLGAGVPSGGQPASVGTGAISIPAHGYIIYPVSVTASTTAANRTITVSGMNGHGTTAQGGEFVYLDTLTDED